MTTVAVDEVPCCAASLAATSTSRPRNTLPLPAANDEEGARVAAELPPVVDAHVHVFPPPVQEAVWRWFDRHGWPVRYRLHADDGLDFLFARGVQRVVLLHYAHKPGMAAELNGFVVDVVARHRARGRSVTGLATLHPEDDLAVLERAFADGLSGVKLHCHVQAMPADDARLWPVYELCQHVDKPVVIHAGREPTSDALPVDPRAVCAAWRVEKVLRAFPRLRLVVPHLGADELDEYTALVRRFDTLWLDTTMAVGNFFPGLKEAWPHVAARPDRVLYGSDFPSLPYAWDRELRAIARAVPARDLAALLGDNATTLFG